MNSSDIILLESI